MRGSLEDAFDILADLPSYPAWWPEIRSVRALEEDRATVSIRSLLPYTLRLELERTVRDRANGILAVGMSGDLTGWDRWTLRGDGDVTIVEFAEVATLERPWLRRLGAVGRPAFIANHALMMRSCRRGLRAALAGAAVASAGGDRRDP